MDSVYFSIIIISITVVAVASYIYISYCVGIQLLLQAERETCQFSEHSPQISQTPARNLS